jgi:hypothetical protein
MKGFAEQWHSFAWKEEHYATSNQPGPVASGHWAIQNNEQATTPKALPAKPTRSAFVQPLDDADELIGAGNIDEGLRRAEAIDLHAFFSQMLTRLQRCLVGTYDLSAPTRLSVPKHEFDVVEPSLSPLPVQWHQLEKVDSHAS